MGTRTEASARGEANLGQVKHVVVLVQENRTLDYMFNGFPGADTVRVDPYSGIHLHALSMGGVQGNYGPSHAHSAFVVECNAIGSGPCEMNGFVKEPAACPEGALCTPYGYAPAKEVAPYWSLAKQGALADETFQCDQGPSFPDHQCIIAAQDGGYKTDGTINQGNPYAWSDNGGADDKGIKATGGTSCGATETQRVSQVDVRSPYPGVRHAAYPCSGYRTVFDNAHAAGLTWRYYSNSVGGFWSGPQAVRHLYNSPNFVLPNYRIFDDLAAGNLANLTYVMPDGKYSDHPGKNHDYWAGTDWVGNIINTIEASRYAKDTVIIVTWDDWGGFYDHVRPPITSANTFGFRVPCVLFGVGVIPGTVDHTPRNQASCVIGTINYLLRLPSMNLQDSQSPSLQHDFNFRLHGGPPAYTPMPVRSPSAYYPKISRHSILPSPEEQDG